MISKIWRSILRGMASVLDINPVMPKPRVYKSEVEAARKDLENIGGDFKQVLGDIERAEKKRRKVAT
jgi:hypothetical protein